MGRSIRPKPAHLAEKLLHIRTALGLTQEQMVAKLNYKASPLHPQNVSGFETGERQPPLPILLRYARVAGVCLEVLVDDKLDLPRSLPSVPGHKPR